MMTTQIESMFRKMVWRFLAPAIMALMQWTVAAARADIVDPQLLGNIAGATCYAETFEDVTLVQGDRLVEGVSGNALATRRNYTLDVEKIVPRSTGTISWWARHNFDSTEGASVISMNQSGALYIVFFGTKGSSDVRHTEMGSFYTMFSNGFVAFPGKIKPDTWHHFALTWNGGRMDFFFDGFLSGSSVTDEPFSSMRVKTVTLGDTYCKSGKEYVFDELRIYNRALTGTDIRRYLLGVRMGGPVKTMALAIPESPASTSRAALRTAYRLSDHSVQVYADLSSYAEAAPVEVHLVVREKSGRESSSQKHTVANPEQLLHSSIRMDRPLDDGIYQVEMTANGNTSTTSFQRVKETWEDNRIGISDQVPDPWTPMEVKGGAVSCWGREYTFTGLGLPRSVPTLQPEPSHGPGVRDVLGGPVSVVAEAKGRPLLWTDGKSRITGQKETEVVVTGSAEAPGLIATVKGRLEYDGLYKVHLTITPTEQMAFDSIRLEVPVPDDLALLFNASAANMRRNKAFLDLQGKGDGKLWDSIDAITVNGPNFTQMLAPHKLDSPVWPHVWLGNDDRGIAVMLDNERTWQIDRKKPCMDLIRGSGRTILRLHLLNQSGLLREPIETTFSLQATPVRSRPKGGSWRKLKTYGWSYFDRPVIWDGCFKKYDEGCPPDNPLNSAEDEGHWWRYGCFATHRIPADDPQFGEMVKRRMDEWGHGQILANFSALFVPSYQQFLLWVNKQWHDRAGLDGMYFDNTFAQLGSRLGSGLAWQDENGVVRPGYNMFGHRDYLKRQRTYFIEQGPAPVIMTHTTDAPIVGTLGFADFWLDGETGGYSSHADQVKADKGEIHLDFVDRWYNKTGVTNLRIALGKQWGVMPRFLFGWGMDATYAMLGLFDDVPGHEFGASLSKGYSRLDGVEYDFGLAETDCEFLPYWDVREAINVARGGPDVLAVAWKRPGRVRVLVSNLSEADRTATVALDMKELGLPADLVATDGRTGEQLRFSAGAIHELPVHRHNYREILLAEPGVFAPVKLVLEPDLTPEKRIASLCDDFSSLDEAWTIAISSKGGKRAGSNCDPYYSIHHGTLRFFVGKGAYALARRRFDRDDCSVQVRIRARGQTFGAGPALILYWDKAHYIQFTGGGEQMRPHGLDFRIRSAGTGEVLQPGPEWPIKLGTVNWVRIALRPNAIDFHCTTDGRAWTLAGTLARKGLDGAPRYLMLGCGNAGENEFLQNDAGQATRAGLWSVTSCFDDLIVAPIVLLAESKQ